MSWKTFWKKISGETEEEQNKIAEAARKQSIVQYNEGLAYAKERDAKNYGLAEAELAWKKKLASDTDAERKTQSDLMLQEATLTPEEINNATGVAASTVGSSFDRAEQDRARGVTRMGVNPGSGRSLSDSRMLSLSKAAAVADATNTTRSNLTSLSKQRKDSARLVRIGLQPLTLGAQDQRIGLSSAALPMYAGGMNLFGNQYSQASHNATALGDQQMQFWGDVIKAGSQVAGRVASGATTPTGGA